MPYESGDELVGPPTPIIHEQKPRNPADYTKNKK